MSISVNRYSSIQRRRTFTIDNNNDEWKRLIAVYKENYPDYVKDCTDKEIESFLVEAVLEGELDDDGIQYNSDLFMKIDIEDDCDWEDTEYDNMIFQ